MEILCNPRSCGDLEEGGRARIELLGLLKKNSAREAQYAARLRQPVALVLEVIWISPLRGMGPRKSALRKTTRPAPCPRNRFVMSAVYRSGIKCALRLIVKRAVFEVNLISLD